MQSSNPPAFKAEAFNCPHCNAYAHQLWGTVHLPAHLLGGRGGWHEFESIRIAFCQHCGKYSIWNESKKVFPETTMIEHPNPDLDKKIQEDYNEAMTIYNKSPRGTAALLRLCIQKLCIQLGKPGKNINDDIGSLVKEGLPVKIQQALDSVRVIGNNSVHPGVIDLKDDEVTVIKLFKLVNFIANDRITQPKEIETLYEEKVPDSQKNAIKKRDEK